VKYTRLGDTGLLVSKLALGTMTFGSGEGKGVMAAVYKVDQGDADRLVAQAIDAGVNHFNSGDVYCDGQSEEILGRALGNRRQDVVISTKVGNRSGPALVQAGLSRRHIIQSVEGSLRRLGTDYIDVYIAHRTDPHTPLEETLEAFEALIRSGKIRYIGYSNWFAWLGAKAVGIQKARGYAQFRAAEMYYSLVGRDVEQEIVPFSRDAGIGLIVWSPLAGGFLSGKYTREDPTGGNGRLASWAALLFDRDKGYAIVDVLKTVAARNSTTTAAVALAWMMNRPTVASVLIGAWNADQLSGNLEAAGLSLSPEDVAALDEISAPVATYPGWPGRMRDALADQALLG
jgi:aryl-alcohol dehydrogenase-like predicted oxidoreductase